MSWALLIELLIAFLPVVLAWLKDILKDVKAELLAQGACPADPHVAIHDVFAAARAKLSWWDRLKGRGPVLAAVERAALWHARKFAAACRGEGDPPVLTGAEYDAIVNA